MDLNDEEILGTFYEKGLQKANQKDIRIKKVTKKKGDKLYVQWKGYDNSFDSCIDKKRHCIKMRQCFPKPQEPFGGDINVKVDLKIKYLMLVIQPKKTEYDEEILDVKSKYVITAEYNRLKNEKLVLKIKQKKMVDKSEIAGFINNSDLNKKGSNITDKIRIKNRRR